jgi:protein-tyrosine phosphatase
LFHEVCIYYVYLLKARFAEFVMAHVATARVGHMGDVSKVAPRLYLGNATAASDVPLLLSLGITLVVNLADDLAAAGFAALAESRYKQSGAMNTAHAEDANGAFCRRSHPMPDNPSADFDLLDFLKFSCLIDDLSSIILGGEEGAVLVHCVSGRNRSATIACALLMSMHRCTARAALSWLQRVRPIVQPCSGYQRGLLRLQDRRKSEQQQQQQQQQPAPPLSDAELELLDAIEVSIPGGSASSTPKVKEAPLPECVDMVNALPSFRKLNVTVERDRSTGRSAKRCAVM